MTEVRKKSKSRTVGNYFGIDFINTNLRYFDGGISYDKVSQFKSKHMAKYKNSFGLKYYYALNYRGFFLAPELFFEYNNIKKFIDYNTNYSLVFDERSPMRYGNEFVKIHKTFGGKINFGYDFNSNIAPFVFFGISKIYYSNLNSVYPLYAYSSIKENDPNNGINIRQYMLEKNQKDPFSVMRNSKIVPLFGFGAKIKISERFLLNSEYLIYNNFKANEVYKNNNIKHSDLYSSTVHEKNQFNVNIRVAKIGLLYNF